MEEKRLPKKSLDSLMRFQTLLFELLTDILLTLGLWGMMFRESYLWRPFFGSPEWCLALALIVGVLLIRYGRNKTGWALALFGLLLPDLTNYTEMGLWHYLHLVASLLGFFFYQNFHLAEKILLPKSRLMQYTIGLGVVNGLIWCLPLVFATLPINEIPVGIFPFLGIILGFSGELFQQSNGSEIETQ